MIKIKFFGGAGGVTGSKTLLTVGDEKYLIDYGLYQGSAERRENNWLPFKEASALNAVFLTHAHIDHSGLLPRLFRDGFRGKVYCSRVTEKLCRILLEDSAKIQEEDSKFANKKQYSRHKPALPLYSVEEAQGILKNFEVIELGENLKISENLEVKYTWAGHILGACSLTFTAKSESDGSKKIFFSGDVGHKRNILLKEPDPIEKTDYVVLESTYGSKLHPRLPAKDILELYLNTILKRDGVAIIPSFSVGRTQDVLYLVKSLIEEKKIPEVPVFLDSPLSRKANEIFNECYSPKFIKEEVHQNGSIYPRTFRAIDTVIESKNLNKQNGPFILISASGMMDGGRVVHHVKTRITDPRNGIILVGYQPEGTKGRILLSGEKILRLHKQNFEVKASVFQINSLSAHGDYLDFLDWIKKSEISPELVILNHGEPTGSQHMKVMIETALGLKTTVADAGEEFTLT
jgi:metallo-beta-lactamase family protein